MLDFFQQSPSPGELLTPLSSVEAGPLLNLTDTYKQRIADPQAAGRAVIGNLSGKACNGTGSRPFVWPERQPVGMRSGSCGGPHDAVVGDFAR